VRVLESRRDLDLPQESIRADRDGEVGTQHLDRHVAVVLDVLGEEHRGHSPGGQLPFHHVPTGQLGCQTVQDIRLLEGRHVKGSVLLVRPEERRDLIPQIVVGAALGRQKSRPGIRSLLEGSVKQLLHPGPAFGAHGGICHVGLITTDAPTNVAGTRRSRVANSRSFLNNASLS
jgi:hypothetical protein